MQTGKQWRPKTAADPFDRTNGPTGGAVWRHALTRWGTIWDTCDTFLGHTDNMASGKADKVSRLVAMCGSRRPGIIHRRVGARTTASRKMHAH